MLNEGTTNAKASNFIFRKVAQLSGSRRRLRNFGLLRRLPLVTSDLGSTSRFCALTCPNPKRLNHGWREHTGSYGYLPADTLFVAASFAAADAHHRSWPFWMALTCHLRSNRRNADGYKSESEIGREEGHDADRMKSRISG